MRRALPVAALLGLALPALALPAFAQGEKPLNAEEFDALTRGTVMDTWSGGSIYGVEKFLPGGKSIWEDERGCMYGTWKQVGELICFTYEDDPEPDCWTYFDTGDGGLSARFRGDPEVQPIFLKPSNHQMRCNEYLGS